MLVFLNGQFVEREAALVSAFDAGFQHGVGLFETMSARNGRVLRGERHMARMAQSAVELGLAIGLREGPLLEAVELTVQRNELDASRVRLTVTGGDLSLLQSTGARPADPTIVIVAQPPTKYPAAFFEQGVLVTIVDAKINPLDPFAGHKTLNYWPRLAALQQAGLRGASEALWFTVGNQLASGCVSNVFLVKEGSLLTPRVRGEKSEGAPSAPVLPGITRETILDFAEAFSIPVERRALGIDDLLAADEIFLTNSSWGVLPVRQVEGHVVGDGGVGEVTRLLREAWSGLVA